MKGDELTRVAAKEEDDVEALGRMRRRRPRWRCLLQIEVSKGSAQMGRWRGDALMEDGGREAAAQHWLASCPRRLLGKLRQLVMAVEEVGSGGRRDLVVFWVRWQWHGRGGGGCVVVAGSQEGEGGRQGEALDPSGLGAVV